MGLVSWVGLFCFVFACFGCYSSGGMLPDRYLPGCINYLCRSRVQEKFEPALRTVVKQFPEYLCTFPASRRSIFPYHGLMNSLTSQTQSLSSHPVLAAHPSLPNKHQSTPHTNSVWRPILPNSLPCSPPNPTTPGRGGSAFALPSVHTRHVMS